MALDAGFHTFVIEGEDVVGYPVGRESQRLVTQVGNTIVRQFHGDALHLVLRPCGIDIPAEPVDGLQGCLNFYTEAVALVDIAGDGLANLVDLTCQYKLVFIVHPVEVSTSSEHLALVLVSKLQVVQTLSLGHLQFGIDVVLEVVAGRLLVSDGVRDIHLVVGCDVVVDSELGVEEVERLVHVVDDALVVVPVDFVRGSFHLDAHMTVLQVDIGIQSTQEFVGHLTIHVEVCLLGIVVIVFVVWQQSVDGTLDPLDQSEVIAIVFVPAATQSSLQVALVVILNGGYDTIEVIVHLLLAYQVARGPSHRIVQVILKQGTLALVLLIVALSLGVVQCCIETQYVVEALIPDELIVLLVVVVRLVVVIARVAVGIVVFTAGVVGATVKLLFVL